MSLPRCRIDTWIFVIFCWRGLTWDCRNLHIVWGWRKGNEKEGERQKVETKVTRRERKCKDVKGEWEKEWRKEGRGNYAMKETKKTIKTEARSTERKKWRKSRAKKYFRQAERKKQGKKYKNKKTYGKARNHHGLVTFNVMVTNIGHLLSRFTGTSERCRFLSGSYSVRLSTELSTILTESFRGFPQSFKNNNHTVSRVLTYPSFMFTVVSNSLLNSSWNLNSTAKKAHIKHHSRTKPKNVLIICVQYLVILWITNFRFMQGRWNGSFCQYEINHGRNCSHTQHRAKDDAN